jgi:hypothetical protein
MAVAAHDKHPRLRQALPGDHADDAWRGSSMPKSDARLRVVVERLPCAPILVAYVREAWLFVGT